MIFNHSTFVGIDPSAGRRPLIYAAINRDLQILALGEGDLGEVTAFVGGQQSACVAVNAPRRPNQGQMKLQELRDALKRVPRPGRWEGYRVAEYLLRQHNIRTPRTPAQVSNCPGWIQRGFEIYRRLENMGFQDYPVEDAPCQMLEVYPHAAFTALLGVLPFPKNSLEGRLQRQLVLHNRGIEIADPMRAFEEITRYRLLQGVLPLDTIYSTEALDALVAAYTAWFAVHSPNEVTLLGVAAEGQIVIPVPELRSKY